MSAEQDERAGLRLVRYHCAHCGKDAAQSASAVNRARHRGSPLFCGRACFGMSRRKNKSRAQRVAEKREYDLQYRAENRAMLKVKKHEYFERTYDPVKAAVVRKKRMPLHVEYCRRPEYRAYKKTYDRQYRAQKHYGDFAECFLLVMDIRDECLRQMSDYEIRVSKGTINKRQQRKRDYERSLREEPQVGPLGNLELGQGWQNGGLASGLRRVSGSRNSADYEYAIASGAAGQATRGSGSHNLRGNIGSRALPKTTTDYRDVADSGGE